MNIVSIAFLFVVAGPLLRRYGLRLGITSNPVVLTVLAVAMIAVYAVAGGGSLALLGVVSAARIADIALTDGTTRTSINATYQVIPDAPPPVCPGRCGGDRGPGRDRDLGCAHPRPQCAAHRAGRDDRCHHGGVPRLDVVGDPPVSGLRSGAGGRAASTSRAGRRCPTRGHATRTRRSHVGCSSARTRVRRGSVSTS